MLKFVVILAVIIGVTLAAIIPKRNVSLLDQSLNIVGGNVTDISLHPFQISLQFDGEHKCGGSLISANWVVTAAHCVYSFDDYNFTIRAGSSRTDTGGQVSLVSKRIPHPNCTVAPYDSDIALLYLDTAIDVANASAATLPAAGQDIADDSTATITGWGHTSEGGSGSELLRQVQIPTINRAQCKNAYDGFLEVTENMFCAGLLGKGGKDACQGDSGGPVEVNGNVAGIVSWGRGCGRADSPGVYTKIANFIPWIKQTTGI